MTPPCFTLNPDGFRHPPVAIPISLLAWMASLIFLFYILPQPLLASEQQPGAVSPYRVQAAFLRNFAHYVTWPPSTFNEGNTPWHIGILGPDPFRGFLEQTFEGRTEQGRSFKIFRANRLDQLPPCQILFIAFHDSIRRRTTLKKLKNKPVLTVGEAPNFLREGGIIQFRVDHRVSMSVNLDQANSVALTIQTKMLEVAEWVIENDKVRKMRQ